MRTIQIAVFVCLVVFGAGHALGAGFNIFEQGSPAQPGMAGAFTARADNPSAIFYNPAGITQLEGTQISVGLSLIQPKSTMKDPYGRKWDSDDQLFYPPNLYVTHKFNEQLNMGFGFGVHYGLGMKWDNNKDFIYRYLVQDVSVQTYYFNPVAAWKVNDWFSIGGGVYYVKSEVEYAAAIDMSDVSAYLSSVLGIPIDLNDGRMDLEGDNGSGDYGFNLGLHFKFNDLRLGAVYRSEVECEYDGAADFTVTPTGYGNPVDGIVAGLFPDTGGRTMIKFPASASIGVAYFFTPELSVEFDINWMGWSSFESLDIDFENPGLPDKHQVKDWDDVFSFRLGTSYQFSEKLECYAGYYFDQSPIPDNTLDPILPGADRHSVQFGAGYTIGDLRIDAAYMYLKFDDRETDDNYLGINGEYESSSNIFGLQFTYRI
ncbi:outer membrane protein transport protein [bacterium]|nr:outer membrane protein transport protein [candidate division CSSED10-310 bacterium]